MSDMPTEICKICCPPHIALTLLNLNLAQNEYGTLLDWFEHSKVANMYTCIATN